MKLKPRHILLFLLVVFVFAARFFMQVGEWYSTALYPSISASLSWLASWIPFSLEEILVVSLSLALVFIVIAGVRRRDGFRKIIIRTCEILLWIYVWFYIAWGCNYYRESIYLRSGVERQVYDEEVFKDFIMDYADSLNLSYESLPDDSFYVGFDYFESLVKDAFAAMPSSAGLSVPRQWQHPKRLLFNRLYSSVGVMGYVGPFFCETQLNNELLPDQLYFVYVHEYSHLLGVSSEDEANFWAYTVCTRSEEPVLKYAGYYGILPYVIANAFRVLPEADYRQFVSSINPEIIADYNAQREYWSSRYSKSLGRLQSTVYDAFLKGNKVSSGTASYLEVIDMITSLGVFPK